MVVFHFWMVLVLSKIHLVTLNLEQYLPIVKSIAWEIKQTLPPMIEYDDLVQSGSIGLLDAAKRYNPDRKVEFSTFAKYRIRGAIMDHLRDMDGRTRDMIDKKVKVNKFSLAIFNEDDDQPIANDNLADPGPSPERIMLENERVVFAHQLMHILHPRYRQIIELCFFGEMTLKDIGKHMSIGESRVSQIRQRAMRQMAEAGREKVQNTVTM